MCAKCSIILIRDPVALKMSNHCKCRSTVSDSISADLIREVRARPALWNCKDENYKSSVVTRKLWNDIGNIINKTDVEARKKWKSLRDMYRRNMHPLSTGQSKKIWKFTESMHFLRDSMSLLPNDVFHDFNENDETNNIVFEEDANESQPGSETSMGMDVTLSVLSDPLRSEPLHSDPLSSEPLHSEPSRSESLPGDPLSSEPLHSEPLRSESLPSDPLRIEQLLNEPSPSVPTLSVPSPRIRPRRSKSSLTPRNTEHDMLELEKAKIEAILNLGRRKVEEGNDDYHFLMSLLPYIKDLHPFVKSELREQVQGIVMKCYRENMQDEQQIGNNNLNVSKGCSSNAKAGKSTHFIIHDTFDGEYSFPIIKCMKNNYLDTLTTHFHPSGHGVQDG
ncbi:uncharacterized protein LOC111044217 [Nilaparvata lugens]|uniref:uncharacterized protein LOC111044217 n=1 Tax=Nilaparvata lugens TaxID=108931 RepID=UPI00193E44D4|nr:uncharacterized protein LOC111044217 [Nilaparvata lugens]